MGVVFVFVYLALLLMSLCVLAQIVLSPFVALWLVLRALVRWMQRRRAQAFPWRPRDWGAEPLCAPQLRASSGERDRVAADLVRHWHDGRLSVEELDERVGKALTARTRGELELLRADLP